MDQKELSKELSATIPHPFRLLGLIYHMETGRWLIMASNHAWCLEHDIDVNDCVFLAEEVPHATGRLEFEADQIREKCKLMVAEINRYLEQKVSK